jgi:hypothetical protein
MSNVPNLDAIDRDALQAFAAKYSVATAPVAAELFPDKPRKYARVARDLAEYATLRLAALRHRELGRVAKATAIEETCDRIYNTLPAYARW